MRYTLIRFDGDTVSLKWEEKVGDAVDKHDWSCDEPPTPAFKAALAAFSGYAISLIEAPAEWSEGLDVRQIALKEEDKTNARGLTVTALRKCPKAKNRTLLLNTPYMSEAPKDHNGPMDGYLPSAVVDLIEAAEQQAEAYRNGERGEQTSLDLQSENTKAVNERMADAEVASTRKAKGRKGKAADVVALGGEQLRQLLLSVDQDVPVSAIERWSVEEMYHAQSWAEWAQRQLAAGKSTSGGIIPEVIRRDATLPISAEEHHVGAGV